MSCEIRALREDEFEAHAELVYVSYRDHAQDGTGPLTNPRWWLDNVRNDPYYSPEQSRVMALDGRLVATVNCYRRPMHCAGRVAQVGAIGDVATHPEHRRQGYIRQVLAEARQWMVGQGFDFSFLFGLPDVYGSNGWRLFTAFDTEACVRVPEGDLGLTVRAARFPEDVPALAAIYDDFNAPLTGAFARSEAYWRRRVTAGYFHDRSKEFHVLEEAGQPVAYYRGGGEAAAFGEIGWLRAEDGLPSRVMGTVLQQSPEATEVRFPLFSRELLSALGPFIWAPSPAALHERQSSLRLVERYKGLWTWISPGRGDFSEVTDTPSLLSFLRAHEYVFWSGVDSF